MKNRKWLTYSLGILLTLVVLAAVGGAGFRIGMMQNASFVRAPFMHSLDGAPRAMPQGNPQNSGETQSMPGNLQGNAGSQSTQGNPQDNGNPQSMQRNFRENGGPQGMRGDFRQQGFDNRGGERRGGFFPIFGLIHLAVLGLLLWLGYKLVKKSGWKLTRVVESLAPAPMAAETRSVEVEEKKESE